jgi:gamma-glutamyltranspeptidase/glutathione hydrolase
MKKILIVVLIFTFIQCKKTPTHKQGLVTNKAMVVSANPLASQVGSAIMKQGGNAIDAMVATHFALAVVYPQAGNIGGGGFMVYRDKNGKSIALDFREKAPLSASRDMYLDSLGNVIAGKSSVGIFSVGVPGSVAGMVEAHKKYGKLPFKQLVQPAIRLAKGYKLTAKDAKLFNEFNAKFEENNRFKTLYQSKSNWQKDDVLKNPALVKVLERIAEQGNAGFYEGETAQLLVNEMQAHQGIMTLEDLKKYKAIWRKPVAFDYKNLHVISMSPPSSGGITLAEIMKMIENQPLKDFGFQSMKEIQVLVEAERRAYADRAEYLGDPDFVKIPLDKLLAKDYLVKRMASFSFDKASSSEKIGAGLGKLPKESMETTHYSIVDAAGNAVSVTTTLNSYFGSKVMVQGAGFFLNNEMDDFSAKPGVPNLYGLVGNEANSVAPEKRMLSSMTPTIVEKNGKLFMVVGTPGGSTIITSVLQTILNVKEYEMSMQEAVDAPRFHHQWLPDVIKVEPNAFSPELIKKLTDIGYTVDDTNAPVIGKVDAILVLANGKLEAGADSRGDDAGAGF